MLKSNTADKANGFSPRLHRAALLRIPSVLILMSECIVFGMARGAIVSDDFNDGNDQGWTHFDPLAPFAAGGTFTVPAGAYRIQAPPSPDQGALGPGRAGSLRFDATYADFFISVDVVDWVDTADQAFGLLSRIRETGLGTTDGYGFLYVPVDRNFEMERFDNEVDTRIGAIIDLTLDPARDYRITFAGTGSSLTGEVFDLADLATPLISLTATDATYTNGVAGLIVADASSGGVMSDATFDNYYSTVPEPGSLVLVIAGSFLISRRPGRRAPGMSF